MISALRTNKTKRDVSRKKLNRCARFDVCSKKACRWLQNVTNALTRKGQVKPHGLDDLWNGHTAPPPCIIPIPSLSLVLFSFFFLLEVSSSKSFVWQPRNQAMQIIALVFCNDLTSTHRTIYQPLAFSAFSGPPTAASACPCWTWTSTTAPSCKTAEHFKGFFKRTNEIKWVRINPIMNYQ